MNRQALQIVTACFALLVPGIALCFWSWAAHAAAPGSLRAEDVLEVDGAHMRRVRDTSNGVVCYILRWPAGAAPDLACVKE